MALEWVDVSDIHLRDIRFEVTRLDGRVLDFSDVVSEFSWADHVNTAGVEVNITTAGLVNDILKIGGEGSSARITAPLADLESGKLVRRELWQGTFEDVIDDRGQGQIERFITGFDILKFFTSNEEDYVFTNSTLSDVVKKLARDFEVPIGTIETTTEKLGQMVHRGRSLWDIVQEAVQRHADATGEVFYVYAKRGRINMRQQGVQDRWWVFEAGESIHNVRRSRSVRDMINQVKVYGVFEGETAKPSVVSTQASAKSQSRYGLRQRVEYVGQASDEARVIEIAKKTLDRFKSPVEDLEITGWLVPNLRAGEQVKFIDKEWGLSRFYYVQSIDSTWATHRAESVATLKRREIDPELILDEVGVA